VLAALWVPVVIDRDSYPLSTYPMYSRARASEVSFVIATGLDDTGQQLRLSLGLIGASDDPLVVAGELRAAVADGRAEQRCERIAERVRQDGDGRVVTIQVVTERHDVVERVAERESLLDRKVHARCPVGDSG
jgi:hypothetical protein